MRRAPLFVVLFVLGCGEPAPPPPIARLDEGAAFAVNVVYEAERYSDFSVTDRPWIPMDVAASHTGQLWVVQRMARDPLFDDDSECTSRSEVGAANDCGGLQGSTVTITTPAAEAAASRDNGRARLVVDANAWHFMRRPAGIAFGEAEITLLGTDIGARDPATGQPLIDGMRTFTDVFATCHEHFTGNYTDEDPYIGPTLWTGQPDIYNGINGTMVWSNGSHLDMVHATEYCVGIAHEVGSIFWVFNGSLGAIDRYDFGAPHFPGHSNHDDGSTRRYVLSGLGLERMPEVPSNLEFIGSDLYIADTNHGRVVRFDTTAPLNPGPTFFNHDNMLSESSIDMPQTDAASVATLTEAFGPNPRPSGLAVLLGRLVIADYASGRIALMNADGTVLRTLDTELGMGIGGLTVLDDRLYFTHLIQRRVYRIDVVE